MNLLFRRRLRWWLLWGAASGLCLAVRGQTPPVATPVPPAVAATNVPPMPVFQPRTELFRKILAMTPADQAAWLAGRPAQVRTPLEAKIKEYQAMTPAARESVLRATELHEYLAYFIKSPAGKRSAQVAQVPQQYRAAVAEKLHEFDALPPDLQEEVLAGKTTAEYFLNPPPAALMPHPPMPPPMPSFRAPMPAPPAPLNYLGRLSPGQRQEMYSSFQHFFDLNSDDRQKILATLPPGQRDSVEKTLRDLESLPQQQRDRGLQSISTLAAMTDDQRQAFFRNAALWEKLPPSERQTWRKMVAHLPPMPPPILSTQDGFSAMTNPAN